LAYESRRKAMGVVEGNDYINGVIDLIGDASYGRFERGRSSP
jgi:hypothetical protein